ncbi:polysaccharide deacetylase family protein [Oscillospiraceae bacterium MB08-C2-2]|nr:polysaccharide deacetylase family protein [Oscillospiraceae bacterium MB08-C2-2]
MINPKRVQRIKTGIYLFIVLVLLLPVILTVVLYFRMGRMMKEFRIAQAADATSSISEVAVSQPDALPALAVLPESENGQSNADSSAELVPPSSSSPMEDSSEAAPAVSNPYIPTAYQNLYFDTLAAPAPEPSSKTIYLTFDNTPSGASQQLLDVLDKYGIKATFFVWWDARDSVDNIAFYKELVKNGHSIGIHSYSCVEPFDRIYADKDAFLADYQRIFEAIEKATGQQTRLYRLPGGSISPGNSQRQKLLAQLKDELDLRGFLQFDWDASAQDAVVPPLSTKAILSNIYPALEQLDSGIVLMHDGTGSSSTAEALDELIQEYTERGYRFLPLTSETAPKSFLENYEKEVVQ